jgi:hypothetical protein
MLVVFFNFLGCALNSRIIEFVCFREIRMVLLSVLFVPSINI